MDKKETTPRRTARRNYEERNKEKRKQASGNFGTMIPRDLFEEINEFLAKYHITKVQLIFAGYEALKEQIRKETETTTYQTTGRKVGFNFSTNGREVLVGRCYSAKR